MTKFRFKPIILTAVAIITTLILLSNTSLNGYSQGLEIPEFKPKPTTETETENQNTQPTNTQSTVKKPSEEIAMKVSFEEHEFLDNYYDVDDFAFVASNTSKLCSSGDCEYELDDGRLNLASAGEGWLTGKFKVDTGESKQIMNMRTTWDAIEERETPDGEFVQIIEGELGIGRDEYNPEHNYEINGNLTSDGDDYILEAKGFK